MKILFLLLFVTVCPYKDSKVAGDLYLYEYYQIDREMPKSKEMLKTEELRQYLTEIDTTIQRIHDLRVSTDEIKFEENRIRVDGEKTKEISVIFITQLLEKQDEILKPLKDMGEIIRSADRLALVVRKHVGPVNFDTEETKQELGERKNRLEHLFLLTRRALNQFNLRFTNFIEMREKLAKIYKEEKVYRAIVHYFKENKEEEIHLPEAENKLKQLLERKNKLEEEQIALEKVINFDLKRIKIFSKEFIDSHFAVFRAVLRFADQIFSVLLGENWKVKSLFREVKIVQRETQWGLMKSLYGTVRNEIQEIQNFDITLEDTIIPELVRIYRNANDTLTLMTTKAVLRYGMCVDFDLFNLQTSIIHRFDMLPIRKHIVDWEVLIIFNFFRINIESFCTTAYHASHSIANGLSSDIMGAVSDKFSELIGKKEQERESVWNSALNDERSEYLVKYWKLKKKIEERAFRILAVENVKEFEPTILNIFTFVVVFASFFAVFMAVRQKEKAEQVEKLNRTDSLMSLS